MKEIEKMNAGLEYSYDEEIRLLKLKAIQNSTKFNSIQLMILILKSNIMFYVRFWVLWEVM